MAKQRSDKSRYPSRYSPDGFVTSAQYITELICEKKARIDKKELPFQFWELPEWRKYYQYQVVVANSLLQKYSEKAIIAALKDNRTWKTYSLRGKWLIKVIEEHSVMIQNAQNSATEVEYNFKDKPTFDSNNNKKSILSKLRELDG